MARILVLAALLFAGVMAVTAAPGMTLQGQHQSTVLSSSERVAFAELAKLTSGRFIWSSNRAGNHELYAVDLADLRVHRLTNHPHVDFFSRVSPNGRWIAFVRSRRPKASFREGADAFDLYVMPASGGQERKLAERAAYPHWLSDGTGVTFLRDNQFFSVDLQSGAERRLYAGSDRPTKGRIGDAVLGPDDLLCVALRASPARGVGVIDLAARTYRPIGGRGACQCTWLPGTTRAIWVESEGQGGTRIMHAEATKGKREVLMDLPGDYSHEYFPRVSADGQWMVWGAAAVGHEHDRADYEMFAWKIGEPWTSAIRLTHSSANDQWPELYNPR